MDNRAFKLGLGTVQFGTHYGISNSNGKTAKEEVTSILEFAKKSNINIIDTASGYGEAEKVLGKNDIGDFRVISKFLPPHEGQPIELQLKNSLQDLRVAQLYGYMAHRPSDVFKNPAQWKELKKYKEEGLIQKIGFSLNAPSEVDNFLALKLIPDIVQLPFNYFDDRFNSYFLRLKDFGCEIHTRSAFLQGLFFVNPDTLGDFFEPVKSIIKNLQAQYKDSLPLHLLKYVHDHELIDCVIIGTETVDQLRANLQFISLTSSLPSLAYSLPDAVLMPMFWPKTN
jgi:aryl-alcohol dehydrogenase-like predicted oxidoreductase